MKTYPVFLTLLIICSGCCTRKQTVTEFLDGWSIPCRIETKKVEENTFPITLVVTDPVLRKGKVIIPPGSTLTARRIVQKDVPHLKRSLEGVWLMRINDRQYPVEGYIFDRSWYLGVPDGKVSDPTLCNFYVTRTLTPDEYNQELPEKDTSKVKLKKNTAGI